jgi:hypothetical protein
MNSAAAAAAGTTTTDSSNSDGSTFVESPIRVAKSSYC